MGHALHQQDNATIVFADIVESVRLVEAGGREAVDQMRALLAALNADIVPAHGGRVVQRLGDGLMLQFDSPRAAASCAFAIHAAAKRANMDQSEDQQLSFRIGIHTADVLVDEGDLYGHGVNLAARIASLAGVDETVASVAARDLLVAGIDADVEDLGECYLKHVSAPLRAFRLRAGGQFGSAGSGGGGAPGGIAGGGRALEHRLHKPCVAVIAPQCLGGEQDRSAVGQVVADDLTTALSRTPFLMVISRLSSNAMQARDIAPKVMGGMLGADYLVSGSYRVGANQIRLILELVRVADEVVLWGDSLTLPLDQIWFGGAQLAHDVASKIGSLVIESEMELVRDHALPAVKDYSLLLGAIGLMFRTQRSDFDRSRAALEHLIDRYPRRAAPYAWLAKWHVFKVTQGWFSDINEESTRALSCVQRALDLQPDEATALTVSGLVKTNLRKDAEAGLRDYDAALEANPNSPLAWLYRGTALAFVGDGAEALANTDYALKLSPFDPWQYYFESLGATAALAAGDWARAIDLSKRSCRSNALHLSTLRAMAIAQAMSGALPDARSTIERIRQRDPTWSVAAFLARSPSGNTDRGRQWGEALASAGLPQSA